MKCNFDSDEWYPVYRYMSDENAEKLKAPWIDLTVELTEEELKDFIECYNRFEAWQNRLHKQSRGL